MLDPSKSLVVVKAFFGPIAHRPFDRTNVLVDGVVGYGPEISAEPRHGELFGRPVRVVLTSGPDVRILRRQMFRKP